MNPNRLYLSPPDIGSTEIELVLEAFQSNWIAPAGPNLDAFELDFATIVGSKHAVAVSSGTAALHLALRLAGVDPGDEVLCSSLTFVASAAPITYLGAKPVFIDSEEQSWNMDPALACAVMHVLFKESYADRDYLARYADVPDELEAHLATRTPEWAAGITGVPAFVVDDEWIIPGAQDTERMVQLLARVSGTDATRR